MIGEAKKMKETTLINLKTAKNQKLNPNEKIARKKFKKLTESI